MRIPKSKEFKGVDRGAQKHPWSAVKHLHQLSGYSHEFACSFMEMDNLGLNPPS